MHLANVSDWTSVIAYRRHRSCKSTTPAASDHFSHLTRHSEKQEHSRSENTTQGALLSRSDWTTERFDQTNQGWSSEFSSSSAVGSLEFVALLNDEHRRFGWATSIPKLKSVRFIIHFHHSALFVLSSSSIPHRLAFNHSKAFCIIQLHSTSFRINAGQHLESVATPFGISFRRWWSLRFRTYTCSHFRRCQCRRQKDPLAKINELPIGTRSADGRVACKSIYGTISKIALDLRWRLPSINGMRKPN